MSRGSPCALTLAARPIGKAGAGRPACFRGRPRGGGRPMRMREGVSRVAMVVVLAGAGFAYESSADQTGAKGEVTTTSTCPSTGGGLCDGLVGYWKLDQENQDGDLVTTRLDETACGNDMSDESD